MKTKTTKKITKKSHPLEEAFNIEPNSTMVVKDDTEVELDDIDLYDEKDKEIENDIQSIELKAVNTFDRILDELDELQDTRQIPRLYEVASNYLNIALTATDKKSRIKEYKDKLNNKVNNVQKRLNVENQNITINTSSLIKQLKDEDIVDGDFTEK